MITSLKDLVFLDRDKILGEGAFSTVKLVRHKQNNTVYALKSINLKETPEEDLENLR